MILCYPIMDFKGGKYMKENYELSYDKFLHQNLDHEILTREEEQSLFMAREDAKKRRDFAAIKKIDDELIRCNQKIIVYYATKITSDPELLMDLIQDVNVNLFRVIEKFDYKLGYKFSTYAATSIERCLYRSYSKTVDTIRKSNRILEKIRLVEKYINEYFVKYGSEPNCETIANEFNTSVAEINDILNSINNVVSYDAQSSLEEDMERLYYVNLFPDLFIDVENDYIDSQLPEIMREYLDGSRLTDFEKDIIYKRYGFIDDREYTLFELAKEYGCSHEWIRLSIKKALTKLYQDRRRRNYLDDFYYSNVR